MRKASDVKDLKEILNFFNEEFNVDNEPLKFYAYYPTKSGHPQIWYVICEEYSVYSSAEFKLSIAAAREKFPQLHMLFCCSSNLCYQDAKRAGNLIIR